MKVQRRAILTVPGEVGTQRCWATPLGSVAGRYLRAVLVLTANQFIVNKVKEGESYIASDDMHVYGPFPSHEALMTAVTAEEMAGLNDHHEQMVTERDDSLAFAHYLLVANFQVVEKEKPKLWLSSDAHQERSVTGSGRTQVLQAQ